jgi:hypothetical protein
MMGAQANVETLSVPPKTHPEPGVTPSPGNHQLLLRFFESEWFNASVNPPKTRMF